MQTSDTTKQCSRRFVVVGLFVATFVVVSVTLSLVLRAMSPPPQMVVLSPKLDVYEKRHEHYDTVFLGTSRTLYHVIPGVVETAASEAGCRAPRVFNFGVYGLTGAEQDWLIRQVLDIGGDNLRAIIVEEPLSEARFFDDVTSDRGRFFHGPENYADTQKSITSFAESAPKRLYRMGVFAYGVAYDLSGVGRAAKRAFPDVEEAELSSENFLAEHGYEALDDLDFSRINARHAEFLNSPEKFEAALKKYLQPDVPNLGARADYLIQKMRGIAGQGKKVAFYVSPDLKELDRSPQVGSRVASVAADIPVLNYNRPDVHEDLFPAENWHDWSHFNRVGATRLSRKIGQDLCDEGVFDMKETVHVVR